MGKQVSKRIGRDRRVKKVKKILNRKGNGIRNKETK